MAKRFYETVGVVPFDDGFCVALDGRLLKTPGKKQLNFRSENRASLVAEEWQAQGEQIRPETMPCTRLMNVAREMTPERAPELIAEFRKYTETDLLCFRVAQPQDLAAQQEHEWQPVLDWVSEHYNIRLATTTGLSAIPQLETSLATAARFAGELDDVELTLLLHFTASLGSAILGLAVLVGHMDIETAYAKSILDQKYQNERWGADDEATNRNLQLSAELVVLAKLIKE